MAPPSSSLGMLLVLMLLALAESRTVLVHGNDVIDGIRVDLTHVDSGGNYTMLELIQRGLNRGSLRLMRLKGMASLASEVSDDEVRAPIHVGNGEFLMNLAIGTPALPFSAIVDTGSDLVWTQCKPCTECFKQPTPIFDPSKSSSFSKLPCSSSLCQALPTSTCSQDCEYMYSYGDYSSTHGILASETFTFGSSSSNVSIPKIGFGCSDDNQGDGFSQGAGLVGLGRGPLSLVSQLAPGKFSYCLTSIDNSDTSPLMFGSLAKLNKNSAQSTPLMKNPSQPTFYYLSLEGISVGGTRLTIPNFAFELQEDGSGGLIIDSGTTITYLEESAYKVMRKAFLNQINLPVGNASSTGLDLCFSLPSDTTEVSVPKLIFHFKGADLDLPPNNYMIADSGMLCLMVAQSQGISIFGNMQQQNIQFLYDLQKETLSFAPMQCDKL